MSKKDAFNRNEFITNVKIGIYAILDQEQDVVLLLAYNIIGKVV